MFEKVNPAHPDKVADRIAGAIVDYAYTQEEDPRVAVEVLIGHTRCEIIVESSVKIPFEAVEPIVKRIAGPGNSVFLTVHSQDEHLAGNQEGSVRCGDNGIFKGTPVTEEQKELCAVAHSLYETYGTDGKYVLDKKSGKLIICQSNAQSEDILWEFKGATVNPLGYWTGGTCVDTGATNRKLGSDMGDSVTGGGLHGKDLSKADVSVNIYAWLKAQETGENVELCCAIGDGGIDGKQYSEVVEIARKFIRERGGFEKFAEWGLV